MTASAAPCSAGHAPGDGGVGALGTSRGRSVQTPEGNLRLCKCTSNTNRKLCYSQVVPRGPLARRHRARSRGEASGSLKLGHRQIPTGTGGLGTGSGGLGRSPLSSARPHGRGLVSSRGRFRVSREPSRVCLGAAVWSRWQRASEGTSETKVTLRARARQGELWGGGLGRHGGGRAGGGHSKSEKAAGGARAHRGRMGNAAA